MGALCGSAGVYNLLEPKVAAELGGCAIQIARHLEKPVPILHPIELLARSVCAGAQATHQRAGKT